MGQLAEALGTESDRFSIADEASPIKSCGLSSAF